jgi:hypothetical protein
VRLLLPEVLAGVAYLRARRARTEVTWRAV